MQDAQIIALYFARDEEALVQTRLSYGGRLQALAQRILHNHEDAEESVSDTYLAAWQTIPPQEPRSLFAYLVTICRRFALGRLDWNNAAKRSAELISITRELEECIPDPRQSAAFNRTELERILKNFVESLPRQDRMLFVRRYWFADPVADIAKRFSVSSRTVFKRLQKIRVLLAAHLEKEGYRL